MPLEPATNAILMEAVKTLQNKGEGDRNEFEQQIFARLGELKTLIERGNRSIDHCAAQLKHAKEATLKACGAYENASDMLATYYVQKRQEEMQDTLEKADSIEATIEDLRDGILKKTTKSIEHVKIQPEIHNNQP